MPIEAHKEHTVDPSFLSKAVGSVKDVECVCGMIFTHSE